MDQDGAITLDSTITQNAWTLSREDMSRKWELFDSIVKAYETEDGSKLDPVLQSVSMFNGEKKYGRRYSDVSQVAIECIAELQARIMALEAKLN